MGAGGSVCVCVCVYAHACEGAFEDEYFGIS